MSHDAVARIVVGIDYSDSSAVALAVAGGMCRQLSIPLIAVHIISGVAGATDTTDLWRAGEDATKREQDRLERFVAADTKANSVAECRVAWGDPTERLLDLVRDGVPSILVIGRAGTMGGADDGIGAVARPLLQSAVCPILLCAAQAHTASGVAATSAGALTVAAVMRPPSVTIGQTATLAVAAEIMQKAAVHQMPVVEDGRLIGIVSRHDFASQSGYLDRTKIDAVMTQSPVTIAPEALLRDAIGIFLDEDINALPVVSDGKLVGIISKTDVLRLATRL